MPIYARRPTVLFATLLAARLFAGCGAKLNAAPNPFNFIGNDLAEVIPQPPTYVGDAPNPPQVNDSVFAQIGERGGMRKAVIVAVESEADLIVADVQFPSSRFRVTPALLAAAAEVSQIRLPDREILLTWIDQSGQPFLRNENAKLRADYYRASGRRLNPASSDFFRNVRTQLDLAPAPAPDLPSDTGVSPGTYDPLRAALTFKWEIEDAASPREPPTVSVRALFP